MKEFKCLSFNVKGIQNNLKRAQIFNFSKEKIKNYGVVLLQETHSCNKDIMRWKNEWGMKYIRIMVPVIVGEL